MGEADFLEVFYESVLQSSPVGIVALNSELVVASANPAAKKILGLTAPHLGSPVQSVLGEFLAPGAMEGVIRELRNALSNQAGFAQELEGKTRQRWVMVTAAPLGRAQGAAMGLVLLLEDITKAKKSEIGLRESEERTRDQYAELEAIYKATPAGLAQLDRDLRFVRVNDRMAAINGRPVAEHIGRSLHEVIPGFAPQLEPLYRRILDTGSPILDIEIHGSTPASLQEDRAWLASYYPSVAGDGKIHGVIAVVVDITDRVKAQAAVAESEQFTRSTLNALPANVCVVNGSGQILFVNTAWNQFARENGVAPQSVGIGCNYLQVCRHAMGPGAETAAEFAAKLEAVLGGNLKEFDLDYPCHTPDTKRWFTGRVSGFTGAGAPRAVILHTDITARKLAEDALRAAEQRFRAIFEQAGIGAALTNPATGQFLMLNQRYCEIVGYTLEEMLSKTFQEITHPDDLQENLNLLAKQRAGELSQAQMEKRYVRKDGSNVWVSVTVSPIRSTGQDGPIHLALVEDITRRKQAEAALRESEMKFRLFVQYAPSAIAMFDNDMRYIAFSRRWLKDYDLADEDITGRSHYEVFPEIPERWKAIHRRCLAGAVEKCDEDPFPRADGTMDWVRWEVRPWYGTENRIGGIIIFSEVITERRQAQVGLRETNERLRVLIDSAPLAILGLDAAGRILTWSTGAEQMFGWRESETVGQLCPTIPPDAVEDYLAMIDRVMHGERIDAWVRRRRKKDGTRIHVRLNAAPLRDATGRITGAIALIEDITQQFEIEEQLRQSEERFRRIAENAPDIIYRFRISPTPGFEFVSGAVTQITGYTPEEHYANPELGLQIIHPEDRPALRAFLAGNVIEGSHTRRWVRKDGATIWIDDRHVPVRDKKGKIVAIEGVARDVTQKMQAAQAVHAANERRRLLSKRLIEVQEAERLAIARELHDEIGQSLTALKLSLTQLARGTRGAKGARELDSAVAITDTVLEQVRSLSLELRPPQLELMGLEAALDWQVRKMAGKSGLAVQFDAKLQPQGRSSQIDIACFRIVQEALTNALRHAGAKSVKVEIEQSPEELSVLIRDDGKGFDVQESVRSSLLGSSMGLLSMEERASLLGGLLHIESSAGAGTTVHARIPLMLCSDPRRMDPGART